MTEHKGDGADNPSEPGEYVAGWNMPGYLPETDPETFESLEDAARYLRETVERWADDDLQDAPTIEVGPDYADGSYTGPYGGATIHLWAERVDR